MKTNAYTVGSLLARNIRTIILTGLCLFANLSWGAVQDLAGRYVGAWTNTTFGSTGKAVIEIQIAGTNATLLFDMDGYVFGTVDPPLISMPGTVDGDAILIDNHGVGMFGDIKGRIDALQRTFSATLTNIPGGSIQAVTTLGTIQGGVISLNYTVHFPRPPDFQNPAYGVMATTLVPPIRITEARREVNNMLLTWTGGLAPFQVQACSNLTSSVWGNIGATTSLRTATLAATPATQLFYRIAGQ
jgi:hypothetical protein